MECLVSRSGSASTTPSSAMRTSTEPRPRTRRLAARHRARPDLVRRRQHASRGIHRGRAAGGHREQPVDHPPVVEGLRHEGAGFSRGIARPINHQTQHPAFRIIPVRLDDVTPPGFLQNYSYVDYAGRRPRGDTRCRAAEGLLPARHDVRHEERQKTSTSVGDGTTTTRLLAGVVCEALKGAGLLTDRDAEDQPSWIEERIDSIMASCGGYAAILPYRPMSSHKTSKYVLREWELAAARGLPSLVVADPRVELPPELGHRPGLLDTARGEVVDHDTLAVGADALAEDWLLPSRSPYAFLATAFDSGRTELRQLMTELIEAVTTMPCVVGDYLKADVVQREILRRCRGRASSLRTSRATARTSMSRWALPAPSGVPVYLLREGPPADRRSCCGTNRCGTSVPRRNCWGA